MDIPLVRAAGRVVACSTVLAGLLALGGCAQTGKEPAKDEFRQQAEQASLGPSQPPRGNVTSFAQAIRCMDALFKSYGAKQVAVVVEEIPDATKKVSVGAKDMFMSATSQMTRSSRAIRLVPYISPQAPGGSVFGGREDVLKNSSFSVQGSISQFDETMLRKQRDGAICLGALCIGGAESDAFSGLSLDLSMIETEGLTLIPGVTAKNFVLIRRKGRGFDGDLTLTKFGVSYNFTFNSSDGQGQALRSLVELSVIELYGRLLKIPYWTCLGLTDADPGVATEIEDWWDTLRDDIPSLISWFQIQLSTRGLYKGEIDGRLNDDLKRAVRAYKGALGLTPDLNVDAGFFKRYLAADHAVVQKEAAAQRAAIDAREGPGPAVAPAAVAAAAPTTSPTSPLPPMPTDAQAVAIESRRGNGYVHKRGEAVEIEVVVARPTYLYCYLFDESKQLTQFFPNGTQPSAAVSAGSRLVFPGPFGFRLTASRSGLAETVACFATARDLGREALGLRPPVRDLASLKNALGQRSGQPIDMGFYDVKVQ